MIAIRDAFLHTGVRLQSGQLANLTDGIRCHCMSHKAQKARIFSLPRAYEHEAPNQTQWKRRQNTNSKNMSI